MAVEVGLTCTVQLLCHQLSLLSAVDMLAIDS